jgi:hypothetical protein
MTTNNETQATGTEDSIFGDVISMYTTARGVEDGVLVDVDNVNPTMRAEAGFKIKVYMTRAAYELCVALSPAAERACNDINGRLWDVLWMLRCAARAAQGSDLSFRLKCVTPQLKGCRANLVTLKAVCGPECPSGEPCLTVMLPGED